MSEPPIPHFVVGNRPAATTRSALTRGVLVFALIALAARGVVADEPKPGKQGSKFEIDAKLVEQSRQAAVDHFAKLSDPKQRPPKVLWGIVGLEELKVDLDSAESIRLAVERAISVVPNHKIAFNERRPHIMLLARVPTPEAFDFLVAQLQSASVSDRRLAANAICYASRWGTPLLIGMLDDAAFLETNVVGTYRYAERTEREQMPDEHFMHRMLQDHLRMLGMRGKTINVANTKQRVPVNEDISRAKEWWPKHGVDYLAGKQVPDLVLTNYKFQIGK